MGQVLRYLKLFWILLGMLPVASYAQTSCEDHLVSTRSELLGLYTENGKVFHERRLVHVYRSHQSFVTESSEIRVVPGFPEEMNGDTSSKSVSSIQAQASANLEKYMQEIEEQMDFVLGQYERRRNWPPSYREKLRQIARRFAKDSIYVSVRDVQSRHLLGTLRFIRAPYGRRVPGRFQRIFGLKNDALPSGRWVREIYGRDAPRFRKPGEFNPADLLALPPRLVPEEEYLGIEVPRRGLSARIAGAEEANPGMVMETGNFAVEKSIPIGLRSHVWVELWLQFMHAVYEIEDQSLIHYGQTIVAYADPFSRAMYEKFGFEPMTEYFHGGKLVQLPKGLKEYPTIEKEGILWLPMIFRPYRIEEYNEHLALGEVPRFGKVDVSKRRREIGGGVNIGPEAIEAMPKLMSLLESEGKEGDFAEAALIQMMGVFHFHKQVMLKEVGGGPILEEALQAALISQEKIIEAVHGYYLDLVEKGNAVALIRMLAVFRACRNFEPSDVLGGGFIFRQEIPKLLTHPDHRVRKEAQAALEAVTPDLLPKLGPEDLWRARLLAPDKEARRRAAAVVLDRLDGSSDFYNRTVKPFVEDVAGALEETRDVVVLRDLVKALERFGPAVYIVRRDLERLILGFWQRPWEFEQESGTTLRAIYLTVLEALGNAWNNAPDSAIVVSPLLKSDELEIAQLVAKIMSQFGTGATQALPALAEIALQRLDPNDPRLEEKQRLREDAIKAMGSIALGRQELLSGIAGLASDSAETDEIRNAVRMALARRPGDQEAGRAEMMSFTLIENGLNPE